MHKHLLKPNRPTQKMKIVCTLAELLKERKISQREFSRITGIRYATLNEICKGVTSHVQYDNLALICQILEVDLHDILKYVPMTEEEIAVREEQVLNQLKAYSESGKRNVAIKNENLKKKKKDESR